MAANAKSACRAERVTMVEVILDGCENSFGSAPCTASGEPCYNTWHTCKDQCNFSCATKSYWFTTCKVPPFLATAYTPNILSVDSNPTTLAIGSTFSTRGRVRVVFQDDAHDDQGFDPYWPRGAIRICAADTPGTLFGRWIERVKYFESRRVNVYHGHCDEPLCKFTKEAYFIDSVSGPDDSGQVSFVLKDPLILADDKNAKCPNSNDKLVATQIAGNEYAKAFKLGVALDGVPSGDDEAKPYSQVNSFLLQNNYLLGDPTQDQFMARVRHACVGSEVIELRAEVNNATPRGWNFKLLDRGVCGSPIGPQKEGASLAIAETFENSHVADVVLRMLTECSEIQDIAVSCCEGDVEQLIDFGSFETFRCQAPLAYVCQAIICKPVGLTTLLDELSEQFLFFLYFDSQVGKIKIEALRPPDCDEAIPVITECEVVDGSFDKKKTDDRYNQITFVHDTIDCAKALSEENLASYTISIRADALREACERREYKTKKEKLLKSRWINECNSFLARANGERWLRLRQCPAEQVSLDLLLEKASCFRLNGYAKIHHSKLQSITGDFLEDYWLVKGMVVVDGCVRLTLERTGFDAKTAPCFDCDSLCPSVIVDEDECEPDNCIGVW